jgi:transposase
MEILKILFTNFFRIISCNKYEEGFNVLLSINVQSTNCPVCGCVTNKIHSNYKRKILDLPIANCKLVLTVIANRYFCNNEDCIRKIFCIRLTKFTKVYGRRTDRLELILEKISVIISSISGSKLSDFLNVKVSNSTLLRITRKIAINPIENLEVIGVDDFAYKKNHTYGTIICDHNTHSVIDIFEGSESNDLLNWLENQSYGDIEIITRDGSQAYKSAIDDYSIGIIQIGDRFHILNNLLKYLVEYIKSNFPSTIRIIETDENACIDTDRIDENESDKLTDKQKKKIELIREVKDYRNKNYNISQIGDILKLDRRTVKKYIEKDESDIVIRNVMIPKVSKLDKYLDTIIEMLNNNHNVVSIYENICLLGYNGCYSNLKYYINSKKDIFNNIKYNSGNYCIITQGAIVSNIWKDEFFTDSIETIINEKLNNYKEVRETIKDFRTIVKEKSCKKLNNWINKVFNLKIPQFKSFANGLFKDIEAVKNAIKYEYSNGLVEGHVNKLKVIKRIMYGRANFDLLRINCIYKV